MVVRKTLDIAPGLAAGVTLKAPGNIRHGEGARRSGGSGTLSKMQAAGLWLMTLAASTATLSRDAHAESARICEQSVQYDVVPMSAEVSPELRRLSGVWQGAVVLSGILEQCVGFVPFAFEPSGRFHARYVWSTAAGRGFNNTARMGNIARIGEFSNGVVRFKGPDVLIEVHMTSPNELSGHRTNAQGRVPVWFKRN